MKSQEVKERENIDPDGTSLVHVSTPAKTACNSAGPWLQNGANKLPSDEKSVSESPSNGNIDMDTDSGCTTEDMAVSGPNSEEVPRMSTSEFILGDSSDNMLVSCRLVVNQAKETLYPSPTHEKRLAPEEAYSRSQNPCSSSEKKYTMSEIGSTEQTLPVRAGTPIHFKADTSIIKHITASQQEIDTVIVCSDGRIGAHRVILVAASPFFGNIFVDHTETGQTAVVVIPDISKQVIRLVLDICYVGIVKFPNETKLREEVFDALNLFEIGMGKLASSHPWEYGLLPAPIPGTAATVEDPVAVTNIPTEASKQAPSLATTESQSSEGSESESGDDDDESKDTKPFVELPVTGVILSEGKFGCGKCGLVINRKDAFTRHLKNEHNITNAFPPRNIPPEDLVVLSTCSSCNMQHKTFTKAKNCYLTQELSRCMTCLCVYHLKDLAKHYKEAHGIKTKHGKAAKCRWCDFLIPISENAKGPLRHAETHIPPSLISKVQTKVQNSNPQSHSKSSVSLTNAQTSSSPFRPPNSRYSKRNLIDAPHSDNLASKKRKLDENGIPLQLAKSSWGPPGKRRKRPDAVSPSMKFKLGAYSINPDPAAGILVDLKISELPKVHVHLNLMSDAEICLYVQNRFEQNQLALDDDDEEKLPCIKSGVENDGTQCCESDYGSGVSKKELTEPFKSKIHLNETLETSIDCFDKPETLETNPTISTVSELDTQLLVGTEIKYEHRKDIEDVITIVSSEEDDACENDVV